MHAPPTSITRPLGVDLFCLGKKFLVFNLVSRNLKIKYRRSAFGIFWTLLSPLAMAAVYYFVFKIVLNVQMPHYLPFILSGVLPWTFFAQSLLEGLDSMVGNWSLFSKVPIPVQVFPFVGTLTNLVTLMLSIPVLLLAAIISGVPLGPSIVLLPVYYVALFLITYGLALLLATSYVYFRDLKHLTGILLQIWMYATPVVYHEGLIPERYQFILYLNPVGTLIQGLHEIVVGGSWPNLLGMVTTASWCVVILIAALFTHRALSREIVERI